MNNSEKIRNIAIIAHDERCAFETPFQGFSTRGEVNKSLLPATLPKEKNE